MNVERRLLEQLVEVFLFPKAGVIEVAHDERVWEEHVRVATRVRLPKIPLGTVEQREIKIARDVSTIRASVVIDEVHRRKIEVDAGLFWIDGGTARATAPAYAARPSSTRSPCASGASAS